MHAQQMLKIWLLADTQRLGNFQSWWADMEINPELKVQKQIIDRVMTGRHALVVMPTGSGKSLCYQLPALALPGEGVTLVFSPLIALMEDQVSALKQRGIAAEYINSTLAKRERERRMKRLQEGAFELIYATPTAKIGTLGRITGTLPHPELIVVNDVRSCVGTW